MGCEIYELMDVDLTLDEFFFVVKRLESLLR